MNRDFLLQSG